MIDLDYDVNNSLVQNYQNIVKNDTVIYCINDADAHCSKPTCDEALDPIRVVTEPVCQQSPTASLPITQPGCSLRSSSVHMLVTVMLVCLQPLFTCC